MKNQVLSYSIVVHEQTYRTRAMVFTSLIGGAVLLVLTLITLYTAPVAAKEQEEVLLLDPNMLTPLMEVQQHNATPDPLPQNAKMHTGLTEQNIHSNTGQEPLPLNTEALFPGMQSEENGEGTPGTHEPGSGTDERTTGIDADPGYKLSGRTCLHKPTVQASIGEEGEVMVSIWVDENGQVTRTSINEQNTNTSSPQLRKIARDSALKTKWSAKAGSPEQKGHIVYRFELK